MFALKSTTQKLLLCFLDCMHASLLKARMN
jgi:hypothetical protein